MLDTKGIRHNIYVRDLWQSSYETFRSFPLENRRLRYKENTENLVLPGVCIFEHGDYIQRMYVQYTMAESAVNGGVRGQATRFNAINQYNKDSS